MFTNDEMGSQGGLVGGESPDPEVVDRDDAVHRVEGFLNHGEADVTRNAWKGKKRWKDETNTNKLTKLTER
jgi:hypothetical protein